MDTLQPGDKVKYLHLGKWQTGIIHAVRTYEQENGIIKGLTYLIDTGNAERIDEYPFNHRDREINKRVQSMKPRTDEEFMKAISKVSEHTDLPPNKMGIDRVRQPEQVELPQEFVKPA